VEGLRIDPANHGGGWRLNQWTAVAGFVGAVGYLVVDALRHRHDEPVTEPDVGADEFSESESSEDELSEPESSEPVSSSDGEYVPGDE
jgi:cytoskeletal protein RodZ